MNTKTAVICLLALLALILFALFIIAPIDSHAEGCLPDSVIYTADALGQSIRYHQDDQWYQLSMFNKATRANWKSLPQSVRIRARLINRYMRKHRNLSKYHAFQISKHPCR